MRRTAISLPWEPGRELGGDAPLASHREPWRTDFGLVPVDDRSLMARHVLDLGPMTALAAYSQNSVVVGSALGPYRLCEPLGAGGMGEVYAAEFGGDECVAVKVLRREWLADVLMVERFRIEAMVGRLVRHDNVVSVRDHGQTDDGVPFLVMERVRGESLGRRLDREGPLAPRRAAAIVCQILAGLDAMHRVGIIHGDVKSDNVMVGELEGGSESAKLIDLGLAQVQGARQSKAADGSLLAGTPAYMAPEVIRGRELSSASDLYAVGVILYELLTGATPFGGGPTAQVLRRHVEEEVVPPSLRAPDGLLPPHLERIVMRALAKDQCDRFPSAAAFARALKKIMPSLEARTERWSVDTRRWQEAPTVPWRRGEQRRTAPGRRRLAIGTTAPCPRNATRC